MSIRPLPKELQEKAKAELNEVPERVQDDLQHIRDWLSKQAHLKAKTDDQTLLAFLRNAKFSLQRTKEKLDAFYTMKTLNKGFINEKNPFSPEIQRILEQGTFSVSTDPSNPESPVVIVIQWANWENISFSDLMTIRLMILDILVNECDAAIINGLRLIEDFKGFSMSYFSQLTPALCQLYVSSLQDVYPVRFQGGCAINVPSYIDTIYSLVKPLIKEKIRKRIKFYGSDYTGLLDEFPLSVLPKEYGGEAGNIKDMSAELKKKIESYSDWFREDAQYGADETKRPGKPKTTTDMFGVDGGFRKLNFD